MSKISPCRPIKPSPFLIHIAKVKISERAVLMTLGGSAGLLIESAHLADRRSTDLALLCHGS